MSESVFDLSTSLDNLNEGCSRFNLEQCYPISGAFSGSPVGQGQASGLTVFQFTDSHNWWSPSNSYFLIRVGFKVNGAAPTKDQLVTYADNFVHTFFTQIQTEIDAKQMDIVNSPWIQDTINTYSNCNKNFLKTWGSLTRVGEPLMTRVANFSSNIVDDNGIVEVVFRPSVALFGCKILPPGALFKISYNWANNGLAAFENIDPANYKLTWNGTATDAGTGTAPNIITNVYATIQEFSFYKASLTPSHDVLLPSQGVINLECAVLNQYYMTSGSLKQNISVPGTLKKISITIQDNNPNVGNTGAKYPATSFNYAVSNKTSNTPYACSLNQLYISLPEIGQQLPNPVYNINGIQDWMRVYMDWCSTVQGTDIGIEGSVPFGQYNTGTGADIYYLAVNGSDVPVAGSIINVGNPSNDQQYVLHKKGLAADAPATTSYNNTARYGWLGRCPGPIITFPIVRPNGKFVSTANLTLQFSKASGEDINSAIINVVSHYSMALAVEKVDSGHYKYMFIEGL